METGNGLGHLMMDPTKMHGCMVGFHILTEHKDANIGPISSLWQKMEQGKEKKMERMSISSLVGLIVLTFFTIIGFGQAAEDSFPTKLCSLS